MGTALVVPPAASRRGKPRKVEEAAGKAEGAGYRPLARLAPRRDRPQPSSLLFRLHLPHQGRARRIAAVPFIDHAPSALVEGRAWRIAAVPLIDHASRAGR